MLLSIKTSNAYRGMEYNNPGPAHLSLGQEAQAVGQAFYLDKNDFIFGSHRSHHEVLAKAFSAIRKMDDAELMEIMEDFMDGKQLKALESVRDNQDSVKELATSYILYGILAEIFAKETGFNQGLGGSMHCYFTPLGIFPNNAIVGGSADIALGAALYKKINRQPGIVIGNLKDDEGTIEGPIGRHPIDRKKMCINEKNGKPAITHYKVLERFGNYTYVQFKLETGRTHQIRVHMASIGHPLLGDQLYSSGKSPYKNLQGQTLHAKTIGFIHPRTNEYVEFSAPLPDYFEKLLFLLKL